MRRLQAAHGGVAGVLRGSWLRCGAPYSLHGQERLHPLPRPSTAIVFWQGGWSVVDAGDTWEGCTSLRGLPRTGGTFPEADDRQAQEHGAQGGVDVTARAQRAASPAPTPTAVRRGGRGGCGEGRLGIEKRGAQAIIRRQRVKVGNVPV